VTISYRTDFECWWPDYDHKPEKCFQFVQHGLKDMDRAVVRCKGQALAVQAGGHAGLWPKRLANSFERVVTFEPEPALFQCLQRNCEHYPQVEAYQKAVGAFAGWVKLRPSVSAGSWRVDNAGTFPCEQVTIDSLDLPACDALFLDVEGYEVEALKGADQTIDKYRPVIQVEQLPRAAEAIKRHLGKAGYRLVERVHYDCIYVGR
jgi:FkbM family methyltransferase